MRPILCAAIVVMACAGSDERGTVLVSAAASLTGAFADMEPAFEARHPGVDVQLNFAGSSTLREQILAGAPVDVFASANVANIRQLHDAGAVGGPTAVFARNRLGIVVPRGNPAGVRGPADFADPRRLLGLCREGVPCGDFARELLARAGVTPTVDTHEPDVRALLAKVAAGELDAGIVYVTDIIGAPAVEGIDIPPAQNVEARYVFGLVTEARNPRAGAAFIAFVLSPAGQAILRRHGFLEP